MRVSLLVVWAVVSLAAGQAQALGSKRIISHFTSEAQWSQGLKTLLNGRYDDGHGIKAIPSDKLGQLQAGPFLETDKKQNSAVVLTMIDGEQCHRLRKPLSQLGQSELPTQLKKISCDDGREFRTDAVLPANDGFAALSADGMRTLLTLNNTCWQIRKDCYLNDSADNKKEFLQTFRFQLTDDLKEIDIFSRAEAFSTKEIYVSPEWRINPIRVLRLAEARSPTGAYRFLLWGNHFAYPTDDENRMKIAAVNPELINSSEKLMLHAGHTICVGAVCKPLGSTELTRYLPFHYMIVEYASGGGERLNLKLFDIDADLPVVEFSYSRCER